MPVIPEALPLMVRALLLSRDWKITIPAYVPLVGGVRLYVPLPLNEMLPYVPPVLGYLLPALKIVTPVPVTLALPEIEKPPPSMR